MYFIVGLGNPGQKYAKTRHNIGFMAVDRLAEEHRISLDRKSDLHESGSGILAGVMVTLVKPLTFMNRSGPAIRQLIDYFREDASQLIVIHDDLDIPLGQIRIKSGGGAGGHNGLSSIIDSLLTDRFLRVRLGIGRPPEKLEVAAYVLSSFLTEEREILDRMISTSAQAVREILVSGPDKAMNLYNQRKS
jgi:PTH1 family peptidyl-tRNA hydrolase